MLAVFLLALVASAAATEEARIIASKFPLSMYAVEQMDLVLEYGLYNTGDKAANKVTLDDRHSFPTQSFEIVKGELNVKFEKIEAGEKVTHSVIVRPKQFGVFNYTAAQVTYLPSETAKDLRVGYTNAPGEGYIYRLKEYERKFAPKFAYWVVFFLILAPTTLGSFLIFNQSKTRYEALAAAKAAKQQ